MAHHAYLIVGEKESGIVRARELFSLDTAQDNPDIHMLSYGVVGIDDARLLQQWAYQKPVHSPLRHFIISCDSLTHETQNALLKLFEEPPRTSAFALIVTQQEQILPTLRSRFALEYAESTVIHTALAQQFVQLSYAERIEEIARHIKNKEEGEDWQRMLLSALEAHFYEIRDMASVRAVLFVRTYSERRGASLKMLLEHLALSLPQS